MTSPKYSLDKENLKHIGKVFLWTVGSAAVAALIAVLNSLQIPAEYIVLVPIVNTVLVALQQLFQEQVRK
jgi:hypothetical protein